MILNFKFKSKNGVLKYLYKKNPNEYWNEVIVSASEGKPINPPRYAIDMNDSTYFVPVDEPTKNNFFSICFKSHFLYLTRYQIETTGTQFSTCLPNGWTFSASNDESNWEYSENVQKQYELAGIHDFSWKGKGFYRCFQITNSISSQCNKYRFDMVSLELFGYLIGENPKSLFLTHLWSPHLIPIHCLIYSIII